MPAHLLVGTFAYYGGIYIRGYEWTNDGLGVAITAPTATLTGTTHDIDYNKNVSAVVATNGAYPKLFAYPWSEETGFGVKYNSAPGMPVAVSNSVNFTHSGNAIIYTNCSDPCIHAWHFSQAGGFGTKYADPSSIPYSIVFECAISDNDDAVVCTKNDNYPVGYTWNYTTGFGTKYANPSGFPAESVRSVAFSPGNNYIILSTSYSYAHYIYEWDSASGFGLHVTSPSIIGISSPYDAYKFSESGKALFIVAAPSPYVRAYAWGTNGLGVKYSNPLSASGNSNYTSDVSPSGKHIVTAGNNGHYMFPWDDVNGFGIREGVSIPTGSNTIYTIKFTGSLGSILGSIKSNIYNEWKEIKSMKVNIYNEWKEIKSMKVNIYNDWKELI